MENFECPCKKHEIRRYKSKYSDGQIGHYDKNWELLVCPDCNYPLVKLGELVSWTAETSCRKLKMYDKKM